MLVILLILGRCWVLRRRLVRVLFGRGMLVARRGILVMVRLRVLVIRVRAGLLLLLML